MNNKIFQFSFGDGYAGSAKIAILSSELLKNKGYDVTLFASTNSLTERRAKEKGIKVIALDSKQDFKILINSIYSIFDEINPQFIISYHSLDRKVGIKLKSKYKKKILNIAYRQNISMSAPIIGSILYNLYYDYQIACSKGVAKSLSASGIMKKKIKVIHNGVEVPENINSISGSNVREKFNLKDKTVLGISSWFHKERKGFDILFKAFSELNKKYVLLIVGIPEDTQNEVKDYAKSFGCEIDRIIMPGYVDNIWEYYKAMDIFLLPSRSEGFSLALCEAGAANLPLIASNIPGNDELIKNGVSGILFSLKKPEELAASIVKVAEHDKLAKMLADNAYNNVMNNFRIQNLAYNLDNFLKAISRK